MILGESAAIAAAIAIGQQKNIQEINYPDLKKNLNIAGRILEVGLKENGYLYWPYRSYPAIVSG